MLCHLLDRFVNTAFHILCSYCPPAVDSRASYCVLHLIYKILQPSLIVVLRPVGGFYGLKKTGWVLKNLKIQPAKSGRIYF